MKITILQRNIEWANPQANIARADEAISCLLDADLFVLPEMFSTGFCTQPEGIAESADSETLHWMKRKAAERNCAIAGSVAVCENGNYYNRFYFVHPEGYRKGSPISYAAGLKGNLLLIHGTGDDNVHYQNCEMLVNELVRHGKIFSQISYPMRSHGIYEGEGTSLHLRKTMADYWLKNLPAGGK